MKLNDIHAGMKCNSKLGSGTVTWVDNSTWTVYLEGATENSSFDVPFEDIYDDNQVYDAKIYK